MKTLSCSLSLLLLCACASQPELCRQHDPPPSKLMQKPQVEASINQTLSRGPDIGRPLVTIGHTADAQIAGLQDYITRVCLAN